eukprot:Platyproteum_vivax@DN7511_c0_g3_i2.p1
MSKFISKPAWVQFLDPGTNYPYFYNIVTRETIWTDPDATKPKSATTDEEVNKENEADSDAESSDSDSDDENEGKKDNMPTLPPPNMPPPLFPIVNTPAPQPVVVENPIQFLPDNIRVDFSKKPNWEELGRPARKQIEVPITKKHAYVEGSEIYNIWYDKYLSERDNLRDREPAITRCIPERDVGWTQADHHTGEKPFFCFYFAKGSCNKGSSCQYFHRLPTYEDAVEEDQLRDVFGRARHGNHRDDMGGVGCFNKDCRTVYIGDLKLDRSDP